MFLNSDTLKNDKLWYY